MPSTHSVPLARSLSRVGARAPVLLLTLALWGAGTVQAAPLSAPAQAALQAIQSRGEHQQGPFIVLDKVAARAWVFDQNARSLGSTPVLLGAARGDDSVPGIGERPLSQIAEHERTTPAGRFRLEPGRNHKGEDIFWVDYDAAVSLHRMRTADPVQRRAQRMASADVSDNRISWGCINAPAAFYDEVIRPHFRQGRGTIYVLPETRPLDTLFNAKARSN